MIEGSQTSNKKLTWGLLGCLLIYGVVRSLFAAAGKSLWYDEILTLVVSSQGSWKAILTALRGPLDGQPPLFYAIENLASRITANSEIGLRLPSILALSCTLTCMFVFVRKRSGEIVAFLCALFLLMTVLFQLYAVEARPYSMVVACIALAMVCYQRATSPLWTALMALSLALAQSLHYLAVLSMVPFGLAESIRLLKTRKIRWPVWAAFIFGALPLFLHWELIALNKAYYGAHFWAKFRFYFLPHTYGDFLQTDSRIGAGVAVVVLAGVLGVVFWQRPAKDADSERKNEDLAEATLLVALAALPFIGYALTTFMHAGLTARYVLCTVLGLAAGFGFILSRARPGAVILFGIFIFSTVGVDEIHFWRFFRRDVQEVRTNGFTVDKFIEGAGHKELPIVVPEGFTFVRLLHYAPPSLTRRLVFLTREPAPNDENWADTQEKGIHLLQSYVPLRISKSSEFTSAKREFMVYWEDQESYAHWLILQLVSEGWSVRVIALDDKRTLCLVTANENSSP